MFVKWIVRLDMMYYKIMLIIFIYFFRFCFYKYYIILNFEYNLKCVVF